MSCSQIASFRNRIRVFFKDNHFTESIRTRSNEKHEPRGKHKKAINRLKCEKICNTYQALEDMQLVPNARKHSTGAKLQESMQLVPIAGKHVAGDKRGKTCNWCEVREKNVAGANRGKTGNWCEARENTQLVPIAGKHATGVKRGKKCSWWQARENM